MIGGIYTGWFSPTEAGAVSLAYALLIEFLVHERRRRQPRAGRRGRRRSACGTTSPPAR